MQKRRVCRAGAACAHCAFTRRVSTSEGARTEHVSGAERGASAERSVRNIVGARSGFLSKGRSDRSVSLLFRSHHESRACTNPPRIHLCLQQLTKLSAYTSKIFRCEGEMEFVKYFQNQTDRSYRCTIPVKKNR